MRTIEEVLKLSASYLEERKIERSRRIAEELLSHVLALKRMDLYLQYDRPIIESELTLLRELLKKRAKGEPLEYVMGKIDFYGCLIRIDRRALIPRPETEILVDMVVKRLKKENLEGKSLWDLCTGSGCIGISIKKALPSLAVTLSDISAEALALAEENRKLNEIEVDLKLGDLLLPFRGLKTDFVICNPPYISESEFLTLDPSVSQYEPSIALVGGAKGTEFYERLNRELPLFLNPGAKAFFEIGSTQGELLKEIFSKGPWSLIELLKDWSGHPRFFFLEKQ